MSVKIFALVLAVVIGVSHTLPAYDSDVEIVPTQNSGRRSTFRNTFDPSDGFGFNFPSFPDFSGFQDYFKQLNDLLASSWNNIYQGIDLSKGNTTSEVKIIDGNRVTINRTVINENGVHAVVQKVDVRPVDDSTESGTPTRTTTASGEREDIETFANANELSKYNNVELLDEIDTPQGSTTNLQPIELPYDLSHDVEVNKMAKREDHDDVEVFDVDSFHGNHRPLQNMEYRHHSGQYQQNSNNIEEHEEVFHDLSGDTYVNGLLARKMAAAAINANSNRKVRPEAYKVYAHDNSDFRDLSRDTYVNELAARRGMPKDPDAEEFDAEMVSPIAYGYNSNALRRRQS